MKILLDFVPGHLLLLFVFGIASQFYFSLIPDIVFGFCVVGVLLFVLKIYAPQYLFLVFCPLGMWFLFLEQEPSNHYLNYQKESSHFKLCIKEVLSENTYSDRFYAEVMRVGSKKTSGSVLLYIEKDSCSMPIQVGDYLYTKNKIRKLNEAKNPYAFDYASYLEKKNVLAQISLKKGEFLRMGYDSYAIVRWANTFRTYIIFQLQKKIANVEVISMTEAMVLGQRENLSKNILENYKKAGVMHILAVSGLHVGILLWLLNWLLQPLLFFKYGQNIRLVLVVLFLWCFAFVAGLSSSVIRAVTMFSFVAFGLLFKKKGALGNSLVSSAFLLLLIHPLYLFDVGFQLSYSAVFSILFVQPILSRFWVPKYKILKYFWSLITVSVAAQVGVLPLSLYYFHQFPGLFVLTNLVVIPIIGLILVLGILIVVGSLLELAPSQLIFVYENLIIQLNNFIQNVAAYEGFVFKEIPFSGAKLLIAYMLVFTFFVFFISKKTRNFYFFLMSIVFFQGVCIYEKYESMTRIEFVVFDQYRSSLLLLNNRGRLTVYREGVIQSQQNISAYKTNVGLVDCSIIDSIPKLINFNSKHVLIVDEDKLYQLKKSKVDLLLLRNSTSINLDKCIEILHPKIIVADGSNYPSRKQLWRITSINNNIPFYDTSNGAYVLAP
ncbi:ComEC/Rec2 family competence protein [Bacteroidota bacterium]